MNPFIKTLAFCAVLGATGGASAAPVYFSNGSFETPGGATWAFDQANGHTVDYPASGGNPGGYAEINGLGASQTWYAVLIGNNNGFEDLANLGLTAGNSYVFSMDMKIFGGGNIGGLKLEWTPGGGDTGDMFNAKIGDGSAWGTYNFLVKIPPGKTGVKVVPLWGPNSKIGYDNIRVDNTPTLTSVIQNGDFESTGPDKWTFQQSGGQSVSYPTTGGNPSGCAVVDSVGLSGFGQLVAQGPSNANSLIPISTLGLTAGQTYTVQQDMKILSGSNIGGLKFEFVPMGTGELRPAIIGDGTQWATYSYQITIPLGCTVIEIYQLWGPDSEVAYDNLRFILPAPPAGPVATIKTGTLVGWTAASAENTYQAQGSPDNSTWTNVGPLVTGNSVSSTFDPGTSPFYQVLETTPPTLGNGVANPGFEFIDFSTAPADNWITVPQFQATATSVGSYGAISPHGGSKMLQLDAATSVGGAPAEVGVRSADFIAVAPLTNYTLSFYAANPVTGASYVLGVKLRYHNEFNAEISLSPETDFGSVGATWTEVTKAFTTPAGAAYVKVDFFLRSGAVPSVSWVSLIDDVTILTPIVPGDTTVVAATSSPGVEVSWNTLSGSTYQVSTSGNLGSWSDFGGSITGNGGVWSIVDALTPPKKFYRVLQTTP